ncbi:acyltransferase family protein [Aquabacterium sp.]|uniref:acyltransferase family protein n=1 Tax=Aquabacterium sp. TaxID=1872578 RepID=UPI004037BDEE
MRIQSVDIARGLCIILVVWGHNAQFTDTVINHALWSIRMPMMFFVAGSFINPQQGFGLLVRQKADTLLKPFVVMALLQAPARMAIGETNPAALMIGILAGGGNYLPWVYYLWYLPHLWLVFMSGHLLLSKGRFDNWHPGTKIVAIILALYVGIWMTGLVPGAPLKLEALPKNLAFFMLGYMSRAIWASWRGSWPRASVAIGALLTSQYLAQSGAVDVSSAEYVISYMVSSLAGITLVMALANGLSRAPLVSTILSRCGRESIFILLFHWPLQTMGRHVWAWALHGADPWLIATLSWLSSISLSLLLAQLMRASYWTAALWLPMQAARKVSRQTGRVAMQRPAAPPLPQPAMQADFADTLPEINVQAMR